MDLREKIARAICGNWIVGDDRPWQQWVEEAETVIEVLMQQKQVAWLRAPDKNNRRKLSFERPTGSSPTKALWSPLYSAPCPRPAVNGGWQLVPIEPTPEMLARTSAPGCAKSDWEKMIAAAPKPEGK